MRIHTEYRSFKNHWTISSSYYFQAHQQRTQRRCFSQTALQWFEVLPGLSPALPGAARLVVGAPRLVIGAPRLVVGAPGLVAGSPRLVVGAPRLVAGAPRCSQVHPTFSPAHRGVPKHITITPMVVLYQSPEIPLTPKPGRNALLGSDTLLKLTHLCLFVIIVHSPRRGAQLSYHKLADHWWSWHLINIFITVHRKLPVHPSAKLRPN